MLSNLFNGIKKKFDPETPIHPDAPSQDDQSTSTTGGQPTGAAKPNKPIQTSYVFKDVAIPPDFLTVDAPDLKPITITTVDWPKTQIPEYEGYYAAVLDNVISPSECQALLKLAEASVPDSHKTPLPKNENNDQLSSWGPALVNMGMGFEVLLPHYRNSDRIIWDQQEVVDRLWERCLRAEGIRETLGDVIENQPKVTGPERNKTLADAKWVFKQVNKRMRFLKYGKGQFFKPHCDSAYVESEDGKTFKTIFTIHLYLNDSQQEVGKSDPSVDLIGGATSFLCRDEKRKVDVDPKAGRVLIFQHYGLLHSGDEVKQGIKYTMRSDIIYEMVHKDE